MKIKEAVMTRGAPVRGEEKDSSDVTGLNGVEEGR